MELKLASRNQVIINRQHHDTTDNVYNNNMQLLFWETFQDADDADTAIPTWFYVLNILAFLHAQDPF